jgi:hypothetical protein
MSASNTFPGEHSSESIESVALTIHCRRRDAGLARGTKLISVAGKPLLSLDAATASVHGREVGGFASAEQVRRSESNGQSNEDGQNAHHRRAFV